MLVLDDREISRLVLAEVLTERGHNATPCGTVEEALTAVRVAGPDAYYDYAFVDLCLAPDDLGSDNPSGLAAIGRIAEASPQTSVIAFSAADEAMEVEGLEAKAVTAGADGYLVKGAASLGELVDHIMEQFTFLREFRQRLQAYRDAQDPMVQALHQLGVGVAIIDRYFRVWYMNETLRQSVGLPEGAVSGRRPALRCHVLFHGYPATHPCLGCCVKSALDGREEVQRVVLARIFRELPGGGREPALRYFQVTAKPIRSQRDPTRILAALETAQDITDTLRVTGMNRAARLELLAKAILDLGYTRCRIYERREPHSMTLSLVTNVGGNPGLAGQEIDLKKSHAASRKGQWEGGAAWFPPGYEREPWHEELGLPPDHMGWVDWPVFSRSGELLGWIAADTAPADPAWEAWPGCGRGQWEGRPITGEDVEPLRVYADHAAQILRGDDRQPMVAFDREAAAIAEFDTRILTESAAPATAAKWLVELLRAHVPGLVHTALWYISEWTQSAVLFAHEGPLQTYMDADLPLYDERLPEVRAWRTRSPVEYARGADDEWPPEGAVWLSAMTPQFAEALDRFGIRVAQFNPAVLEGRVVGVVELHLASALPLASEGTKWLVERGLERAGMSMAAARLSDRLRDEAIDRAMPDMLPAIAHKLGTPLFLINSEIRAWRRDLEANRASLEGAANALSSIERHLERIDSIRREFLQVATAGTRARGKVDLVAILRSAVTDATAGVAPEFKVEYSGWSEPAYVNASEQDLSECFYELAANAVKALDGQGTLYIDVAANLNRRGEVRSWRIGFRNAGIIPPEEKNRIFDPFYTTNLASGTGLGLAMVRRLLRAHEATIREVGTDEVVFEIVIPAWREGV